MRRNYIILMALLAVFSCKNVEYSEKSTLVNQAKDEKPIILESEYRLAPEYLLFTSKATRIRKIPNEYLPTSERFRVIVIDDESKEIWNSSQGKSYMQATQDVLPVEIGDTITFSHKWNFGKSFAERSLQATYQAILMIPAQPNPYTDTLLINIE